MNANELRIGNFIFDGNKEVEIIGILRGGFYLKNSDLKLNLNIRDRFIPIPLTEKWLFKFGFVKRGIYYHFPKNDIFKLDQYKNKNAYWLRYYTEDIDCTRINHVHQLQNLYFALTGEELTPTNHE